MGNSKSKNKWNKSKSNKRSKKKKPIHQPIPQPISQPISQQQSTKQNIQDLSALYRSKFKNKIFFYHRKTQNVSIIGEYYNDIIPISLKNELILEIKSLMNNKSKLNYRNLELAPKYDIKNIQIQDLIEPSNPFKANNLLKDGELIHISFEDKYLMILVVMNTFNNLIEERIWSIDNVTKQRFNAHYCYEKAMEEDIPWKQWNHWVREIIVTFLRENNRISSPNMYYASDLFNYHQQTQKNDVMQTENTDNDNKTDDNDDINDEQYELKMRQTPWKSCDQWTPTIFRLNEETNLYEIVGEINDLPRNENDKLYDIIQRIFSQFIPNINRCLDVYPITTTENIKQDQSQTVKYKEYHVIIKLNDYQFMDKTNSSFGGSDFHSIYCSDDGCPDIKAVVIYYFDISCNIQGGDLCFYDDTNNYNFNPVSDEIIKVKDNLCIFHSQQSTDNFSFDYQQRHKYKTDAMKINDTMDDKSNNLDKNKYGDTIYGTRKKLGFFIIDKQKQSASISTNHVIVNFDGKISLIINYWIHHQLNELKGFYIGQDIIHLISIFICGDIKYMKYKHDYFRSLRYGKHQDEFEKYKYCERLMEVIQSHKQLMERHENRIYDTYQHVMHQKSKPNISISTIPISASSK